MESRSAVIRMPDQRTPALAPRGWRWLALPVAAVWSLVYLVLAIAWLAGASGNPADPVVDPAPGLSLLGVWGPRTGAAVITGLAAVGLLLSVAMTVLRPARGRPGLLRRMPTVLAAALGLVLAVVLPDYRLLAAVAYTPILVVLRLTGSLPEGARV